MKKIQIYCIVATAAIGGLLFGFDTSIIAGGIPFIQKQFNASYTQIELVVSICVLGAFIGATVSGKITDYYGRKYIIMLASILCFLGSLISGTATTITILTFGRLILGIAIGILSYATPLFIAEIAPPEKRGGLLLCNGAFLTGGQVIAFFVGYYFTSSGNWQAMMLSGIIPAMLLIIGMFFMPRSPKWLITKGKKKEAKKVLEKLRTNIEKVKIELQDLENSIKIKKSKFIEIFYPKNRKVLYIGLLLGIFQQFFGINTVMYYGPYVIKNLGFSGNDSQMLGTLGLGMMNFIFTILSIFLIDRVGRRKLLLLGSIIASLSLFAMIIFLSNITQQWSAYAAIVCLFVYIAGFCISVGSLFWVLIAEIFPLYIRGACMSFTAGIQWAANFLVTSTFLTMLNSLGFHIVFSIYAIIALITFLYVYKFVPETKGVSLETIEKNLNNGVPTRYLGQTHEK